MRPARADQLIGLDTHREAPHQRGRPLALGTQQQGLAGVRVRRPRLGVQVVAVVPDHHETEPCDRCERRGAGADHHPAATARDREEVAVALRGTRVGGEHDVLVGTEHRGQRGVDLGDVLAVGHDDQGAPAARDRCRDGVRDERRPVGAGGGAPDRPRRPAVGQVGEERGRGSVGRPGGLGRAGVVRRWRHRRHGVLLLGGRVPAGHGQPQHVGAGAGVALGQLPGQRGHLGRQHRLGTDHPTQRRQRPLVIGARDPLEHEAVDVAAREPHLDPHPRPRVLGHRRGHPVVEGAVEVRERHVDEHPRDRVDVGHRLGRGHGGLARRTDPGAHQPREQLLLLPGLVSVGRRSGHGDMDTSHRPRMAGVSPRRPPSAPRRGRSAPR